MVPKTTVAMFHWVNIDYDIFMKLELKNLKGDSSRTERRLRWEEISCTFECIKTFLLAGSSKEVNMHN